MEQKEGGASQERNKTLWKVISVLLFVMLATTFIIAFSMFYWPSIPSSPQRAQGRIYPLNNHGRYTFMNHREYQIQEGAQIILPLTLASIGAIYYFIDPFDLKSRQRRYRRPPRDYRP